MSRIFPSRRSNEGSWIEWFAFFDPSSNWKHLLAGSNLPEDIQSLIRSVIVQSGLMRYEKAVVTSELISHFEDGHQRGRTFEFLKQQFGDAAVTAQLIRRSKIRNRPMMMKLIRALGISAATLLAAYVGLSIFFYLGKPNPTNNYLADLNRPIVEADDADKAWPIYRPMWTKYGFSEGGGFDTRMLFLQDEDGVPGRFLRPGDEDWPMAVAKLNEWQDLMVAFRAGARLPRLGIELQVDPTLYSDEDFAAIHPNREKSSFDPSWGVEGFEDIEEIIRDSLINVLLPHVQVFRTAARMFIVDTRLAIELGDRERALTNIETMLGLSNHAAEGNVLVCSLVGIAIANMAFDTIEETVEEHPDFFSAEDLERLQQRVESVSVRDWVHFEGERYLIYDLIQRTYTDDGKGDGRMTHEGIRILDGISRWWAMPNDDEMFALAVPVVAPASLVMVASRKEIKAKADEMLDRIIADLENPFWAAEHPDYEDELEQAGVKYLILNTMFPAYQQVRNAMDRTIGRQEGVIAALAIHRYAKTYGEWPTEFADVSPEFVVEFPLDQLTGGLLNFTYDDDSLIVYSVGNDRDDDGGQDRKLGLNGQLMPRNEIILSSTAHQHTDGDWIVWPARNEGR